MKVQVTSSSKSGNEILGTKDTQLYYLLIGEKPDMVVINVGKATFDNVKKLVEWEQNKNGQSGHTSGTPSTTTSQNKGK